MTAMQEELESVMEREVRVLREMLSSIQLEQEALLENDADKVRTLNLEREAIAEELQMGRARRKDLLKNIGQTLGLPEGDDRHILALLQEYMGAENCSLLSIRDQMLSLLEQIEKQHQRNNYFLEKKVQRTRRLMERLRPEDPNKTYGRGGHMVKTKVKTKTTLLNREV